MFSKRMLLSYQRLDFQSFAMHDEKYDRIVYTHHYNVTYKKSTWWGLIKKIVTEKMSWNAPDKVSIEKQLDQKIGKWIK